MYHQQMIQGILQSGLGGYYMGQVYYQQRVQGILQSRFVGYYRGQTSDQKRIQGILQSGTVGVLQGKDVSSAEDTGHTAEWGCGGITGDRYIISTGYRAYYIQGTDISSGQLGTAGEKYEAQEPRNK
jgi:hypothetical protein